MHRMDSHGSVMPTDYTNFNTKASHKGHSQDLAQCRELGVANVNAKNIALIASSVGYNARVFCMLRGSLHILFIIGRGSRREL